MGHFVSSPREKKKRDSRGDESDGQGRKRNRNESTETEEITLPSILTCYKDSRPCPTRHLRLTQPPLNILVGHFIILQYNMMQNGL